MCSENFFKCWKMTDLNQLRTAWHTAQRNTFAALEALLEKWDNKTHIAYKKAVEEEKSAEYQYWAAIVAGKKQNLKRTAEK